MGLYGLGAGSVVNYIGLHGLASKHVECFIDYGLGAGSAVNYIGLYGVVEELRMFIGLYGSLWVSMAWEREVLSN